MLSFHNNKANAINISNCQLHRFRNANSLLFLWLDLSKKYLVVFNFELVKLGNFALAHISINLTSFA